MSELANVWVLVIAGEVYTIGVGAAAVIMLCEIAKGGIRIDEETQTTIVVFSVLFMVSSWFGVFGYWLLCKDIRKENKSEKDYHFSG